MDDTTVLKRIEEIAGPGIGAGIDIAIYRAAYADGLEAAAKIGESVADLLYSSSPSHRKGCTTVVETIRQHAKEMGHE